jgi:hypothetical protein
MAKWFELPDLPIRITARGEWLHGDEPLHPRVATLFARNVVPHADGTYFVQLGYARQQLEVEDTAFFVRSLRAPTVGGALGAVTLHTSDDVEEALDPSTLMQSEDNVFYCAIKRHDMTVPCRFTPAQYHELALHAEVDGDAAYLIVGGKRWPIKPYRRVPQNP